MFRYTLGELPSAYMSGWFNTGDTVTISIYKLLGGSVVPIDTAVCLEIGTTGQFRWSWDNITTKPLDFVEYISIMDNSTTQSRDQTVFGGYPELIDPTGTNVVTITVEETDTTPIPDVFVKVYNLLQTVLLRTATSDTNGEVVLNMEDGTYTVVLVKNQVNFDPTETLVVSGPTTDTYNGEVLTIPVPATANVCRVTAFSFVQNSVGATPTFDGTATIKTLFNIDNIYYEGQTVPAVFDAGTGQFYWDLPYNAVVKLNSKVIGLANGVISVPPQAAASLNDLDIR